MARGWLPIVPGLCYLMSTPSGSAYHFSPEGDQAVLNQWNTLVEAIKEEDQLLRRYLTSLPRSAREDHGPDGTLSFKETLGHIAFWDDFTVQFFQCKLDTASCMLPPPVEFEKRSREALSRIRPLPFGEVLARYLESTGALIDFLMAHWNELTERERHDFWVPLKHRRHHRISLGQAMGLGEVDGADEGLDRMAAGA